MYVCVYIYIYIYIYIYPHQSLASLAVCQETQPEVALSARAHEQGAGGQRDSSANRKASC